MTPALLPGRPPAALDRRAKAAIVVRFLLADGRPPPLAALPEDTQVALAREVGRLGLVDRATLDAVIDEFAAALEGVGLAAPPGEGEGPLDAHLSPAAAQRLREERARAPDPWGKVAALPPEALRPLLERESVEVAAVALSKLPVERAAEALGLLPGERARRVAAAVSRTAGVAPAVVARIGRALAADYAAAPPAAFADPAGERVGAILNSATPARREALLEGLDAEDRAFGAAVRRAIFTWAHLPRRLRAADVPRALRAVDAALAATALAAARAGPEADRAAADFVLGSLTQRMADSLREAMAERGKVAAAEGEAAQAAVVAAVRAAAAAGELSLVEPAAEAPGAELGVRGAAMAGG